MRSTGAQQRRVGQLMTAPHIKSVTVQPSPDLENELWVDFQTSTGIINAVLDTAGHLIAYDDNGNVIVHFSDEEAMQS